MCICKVIWDEIDSDVHESEGIAPVRCRYKTFFAKKCQSLATGNVDGVREPRKHQICLEDVPPIFSMAMFANLVVDFNRYVERCSPERQ